MDNQSELSNYVRLDNGVVKQINISKIEYNYEYSNKYNCYGEKSNYLSYLRLGVLLGAINKIPNSILDVGYGNGAFLNASKNIIKNCHGFDISGYPLPNDIIIESNITDKHFDDINVVDNLNCDYIFISVPWCHYLSDEWFLNWYHRRPDEHLWHFNDESLSNSLTRKGIHVYIKVILKTL